MREARLSGKELSDKRTPFARCKHEWADQRNSICRSVTNQRAPPTSSSVGRPHLEAARPERANTFSSPIQKSARETMSALDHYENSLSEKTIHNQKKRQQTMLGQFQEGRQSASENDSSMEAARRRTFNEISTLRRQARKSSTVIGSGHARRSNSCQFRMSVTNFFLNSGSLCRLGALCLILLVAIVAAESFNSNSNSAQQRQEGAGGQAGGELADFAVAASNNYQQQQQQHIGDGHYGPANGQQPGQKSKKIQIVYIKVPLAKLRPSLGQDAYSSGGNSSGAGKASEQYETTDSKSQQQSAAGSHHHQQTGFGDDQQQQINLSDLNENDGQQRQIDVGGPSASSGGGGGFQQAQSFLIPMAVVQASHSAPSESDHQHHSHNSDNSPFNYEPPSRGHQQSMFAASFEAGNSNGAAGSQLFPQHAQPSFSGSFHPELAALQTNGHRFRSPAMNLQEHNRQLAGGASIPHGFMSSFLLGEKEKMTAAALRLQKQRQLTSALATSSSPFSGATNQSPAQAQAVGAAASQPSQQQVLAPSNNDQLSHTPQQPSTSSSSPVPSTSQPVSLNPKGSGGLMPSMIAPLSRMPDNAIGQAYGAAVGIALPAESGSPSSLLSSPSSPAGYGKQQPRAAAPAAASSLTSNATASSSSSSNYGTSSGTPGEGAFSSGTGSSTSYGASGPNQQGAGSSGRNYPQSSHAFAASAHSSGYGNGISTSGASGAFSDYPAAGSSSSSSYNRQPSQQGSSDYNGRLKQAKKTIIPIVVQVEHAILENNGNNINQNSAYQQHAGRPAGNKYGAQGGRHGDGKRGSRYNSNKQQNGNHLYGAATNEIAQYGDIPPGAQWVNAANAFDINQITAQINAENAASAAAALAQADAAFGPGAPAGYSPPSHQHQSRYPNQRPTGQANHNGGASAYAAGLQSAASALLANSHPVIQAAASGGLASVSKLGAKLGEMIALPSMQMPGSIASIGSSLPSAFSSITNQMGVQLNQAVQQVAKEHPHASAFARQVAHQAGIQLPFAGGNQQQQIAGAHQQSYQQANGQQQAAAASNQHISSLSPQAQLQNLKLSIGQNLQTAAASLIGVNQKANALSGNQLLGNANQMAFSAALKQLSAISPAAAQLANQLAGSVQAAASNQQQTAVAPPADSSGNGLSNVQQGQMNAFNQFMQQQQSVYNQLANFQQAIQPASGSSDSTAASGALETSASAAKPVKSSSFKSKFLSFFQPPKFISNFLSWNDRAGARNDKGEMGEIQLDLASFVDKLEEASSKNATTTTAAASTKTSNTTTTSLAPSTSLPTSTTATSTAGKSVERQTTTGAAQRATSVAPTSVSVPKETTAKVQEAPRTSNATATTVAASLSSTTTTTTTTNKRDKN